MSYYLVRTVPLPYAEALIMDKALRLSAIACLLLLFALFAAAGSKAPKPGAEVTRYGTISCSIPPPPPDPAKAGAQIQDTVDLCIARSGKVVIVDDVTKNLTPIENPETVKGYEGKRVSTSGWMNGDNFHVISLRHI
jgi:hypothetical protein